jgi:glutathione-regulated potassium-efflux system protein KefB
MKIYYGDGSRLDILHAAGADTADVVLICIDNREATTKIAELLRDEFPLVKVMARAYDRAHALELVKAGVEYQLRELFESALTFGAAAIRTLGGSEEEIAEVMAEVRRRDEQRFEAQLLGGIMAGRELLLTNAKDQAREVGAAAPSTRELEPSAAAE